MFRLALSLLLGPELLGYTKFSSAAILEGEKVWNTYGSLSLVGYKTVFSGEGLST